MSFNKLSYTFLEAGVEVQVEVVKVGGNERPFKIKVFGGERERHT